MPEFDIQTWPERIRQRYENYLKTFFFFRDPLLRESFENALREEGSLLKGPYREPRRGFKTGLHAHKLANEFFPESSKDLLPALIDSQLYTHQERAIRATHVESLNVVVSTGTASGKTESFLYSILFELYRQHLAGELEDPGVRAMILYPMNALANDQRERLGAICQDLRDAGSGFEPTFGQYIGQTPYNAGDRRRNAIERENARLPGELVFREDMRQTPPHILLTNYSMLEYLLIRPDDSPLFDRGRGMHWQFIVLDEAHQYRGVKGMEVGMLIRRLKQRLCDGGRRDPFRCIATSATITSRQGDENRQAVAGFAEELFGEPFSAPAIVFGESSRPARDAPPQRYHAFLRALEGAFLVHREGADAVVLNRKRASEGSMWGEPLEIALCRECGQYYYVGRQQGGKLEEAIRDPSHGDFGVEYYLPADDGSQWLCRRCGTLSSSTTGCNCGAAIRVKKCDSHKSKPDQLKECAICGYRRGGAGDPVQEIAHGSDGPNSVIVTALHELLPEDRRKVLAFADSRQEAAFFAWYAEDSYKNLRDRNLILKAIQSELVAQEGLSVDDLQNRLLRVWHEAGLFSEADTKARQTRLVLTSILREAMTENKRLSLSGVGLVKWFVALPRGLCVPDCMGRAPWNLSKEEGRDLIGYLLDEMRPRRAMNIPAGADAPTWNDLSLWSQQAFCNAPPKRRRNVIQWGGPRSAVVSHFLRRLLTDADLSEEAKREASKKLIREVWWALHEQGREQRREHRPAPILQRATGDGTFRLNPRWLRIKLASLDEIRECNICATVSSYNIRGVCPRNGCRGVLSPIVRKRLAGNHYRILYESRGLPAVLRAKEHTAQIDAEEARRRQDDFKEGRIHLLSSSTTFEVGVDLGNLDSVFLRNVPPESFNYAQRVGRAGRRNTPGLVLTYCRRNPHDLYHYDDPFERVMKAKIDPPRLRMTNEKIVRRHMVAVALSEFFKNDQERFKNVGEFVGDWLVPRGTKDLYRFCEDQGGLKDALARIVPDDMHERLGLDGDDWVVSIAGEDSRLALAESEVCSDYREMERFRTDKIAQMRLGEAKRINKRLETIATEKTLDFLSRKAVIPKYGFPVDVVELDVHPLGGKPTGVALQRDMSQAIAEYAPGGKVVANKLEWESCGIKLVTGKAWPVHHYQYDDARNFRQWNEDDAEAVRGRKYLIPKFGFVTPLFKRPSEPKGRARRLYTTRPFFRGFKAQPESKNMFGAWVTKAVPGVLVILCEGRKGGGFYICRECGRHMTGAKKEHRSPKNVKCAGTLEKFSLGHELHTDVLRIQFPMLNDMWDAYSVAYAVLLGAADKLNVPHNDLNVTIAGGDEHGESAIVLYDNVPGGAGLVVQLENEDIFGDVICAAVKRVQGNCGCDSSCYGCLRSYRNQFAHSHLDRTQALKILT